MHQSDLFPDAVRLSAAIPTSKPFYKSDEWLRLRYFAIREYGGRCMCCGTRGDPRNPIQVDHIKPRSLFPQFALDPNNLQVLCRECNLGKSNIDDTDWRDFNDPY